MHTQETIDALERWHERKVRSMLCHYPEYFRGPTYYKLKRTSPTTVQLTRITEIIKEASCQKNSR